MNEYTIIGVRACTFKKSGRPGYAIFTTFKQDGVDGLACESIFVLQDVVQGELKPGRVIDVRYNRNGFVDTVTVLR